MSLNASQNSLYEISLARADYALLYENHTIHIGDLIIDGNQTCNIENCTYTQTGNIYVKDNAFLAIKNAELVMNLSYFHEYEIKITDTATLAADIGITRGTDHFLTYVQNNATFNAIFTSWEEAIFLYYDAQYSNALVLNSTTGSLDVGGQCSLSIRNSTVSEIELAGGSPKISIHNSSIGSVGGSLSSSTIEVYDSRIQYSWLRFDCYISNATLTDLNPGFYKYWNIQANVELFPPCLNNLTLMNTEVLNGWDVWFDVLDNSHIEIRNSTIHSAVIRFERGKGSTFLFRETNITTIGIADFEGILLFENVSLYSIAFGSIFASSDVYIGGNITFYHNTQIDYWENASVTRNFSVIAMDKLGNPLITADLTLYDQNNKIVWSGFTDDNGRADFNVTFTEANYTEALTLESANGFLYSANNITFLIDTPVSAILWHPVLERLFSDYDNLQENYSLLNSSYNSLNSELNYVKNLMYVSISATIIFIATTVYLVAKRPKPKQEP